MKPYYAIGDAVLYLGDCRDLMHEGEIETDHVITDPPYSAYTHANARGDGGKSQGGSLVESFAPITQEVFAGILAAIKPKRWMIATMDWRHVLYLEQHPPSGLRFIRHGVWIKPDGAPQFTGDRPATGWESVVIMHSISDSTKYTRWNSGGARAVWTCNVDRSGWHPTNKPIPLLRSFVTDFTDPGETILDPFAGSGSTLVAAQIEGRKSIGIEIDEQYCEVAARRLGKAISDPESVMHVLDASSGRDKRRKLGYSDIVRGVRH